MFFQRPDQATSDVKSSLKTQSHHEKMCTWTRKKRRLDMTNREQTWNTKRLTLLCGSFLVGMLTSCTQTPVLKYVIANFPSHRSWLSLVYVGVFHLRHTLDEFWACGCYVYKRTLVIPPIWPIECRVTSCHKSVWPKGMQYFLKSSRSVKLVGMSSRAGEVEEELKGTWECTPHTHTEICFIYLYSWAKMVSFFGLWVVKHLFAMKKVLLHFFNFYQGVYFLE